MPLEFLLGNGIGRLVDIMSIVLLDAFFIEKRKEDFMKVIFMKHMNSPSVTLHIQLYPTPLNSSGDADNQTHITNDAQSKPVLFSLSLNDALSTVITLVDSNASDISASGIASATASASTDDPSTFVNEIMSAAKNGQDDNIVLFKIQSTQSNRYKVKPAEGILSLRKRREINISITLRAVDDANNFIKEVKGKDVLLVRSLKILSSVLKSSMAASKNDANKALKEVWTKFGDKSEKKYLPVAFSMMEEEIQSKDNVQSDKDDSDPTTTILKSILPPNKEPSYIMHLLTKNWSTFPKDKLTPEELNELKLVKDKCNPSQWEKLQSVSKERLSTPKTAIATASSAIQQPSPMMLSKYNSEDFQSTSSPYADDNASIRSPMIVNDANKNLPGTPLSFKDSASQNTQSPFMSRLDETPKKVGTSMLPPSSAEPKKRAPETEEGDTVNSSLFNSKETKVVVQSAPPVVVVDESYKKELKDVQTKVEKIEQDTTTIRDDLSKLQKDINNRLEGLENQLKNLLDEKVKSLLDDVTALIKKELVSHSEAKPAVSTDVDEKLSAISKSVTESNNEAKKELNIVKEKVISDCKAINAQSISSINAVEEKTTTHIKSVKESMEKEMKSIKESSTDDINKIKDDIQTVQNRLKETESRLVAQIEEKSVELKILVENVSTTLNNNQKKEVSMDTILPPAEASVNEQKQTPTVVTTISSTETQEVSKAEEANSTSAASNPSHIIVAKVVHVEVYGVISPTWAASKLVPSASKGADGFVSVVKDENLVRIELAQQESGKMFLLDHVCPSDENIVQELITDLSSIIDKAMEGDICSILLCGDTRSGKGLIIDGFDPIDSILSAKNDSLNSSSQSTPKQKGNKIANHEGMSFYLVRHLFKEVKSKTGMKVFMSYEYIDQNDKIFNILDNKNEINEEFAKKEIKSFADYMKVKSEADIMLKVNPHYMVGHKILTIIIETQSDSDSFRRGAVRLIDLIGIDISNQNNGLVSYSKYPQSNPRYGIWPSLPSKFSNANSHYHTILIAALHPQLPREAIQTLNFIEGFRQFHSGSFATV